MTTGRSFPLSVVLPASPSEYDPRDQDNMRRILSKSLAAANAAERTMLVTDLDPGSDDDLLMTRSGVVGWTTLAAGDIPDLAASKITAGTFGDGTGTYVAEKLSNTGTTILLRAIDYTLPAADASGVLTSDGAGGLTWETSGAPGAHASTHNAAQSDALDLANLGGTLGDGSLSANVPLLDAANIFSATQRIRQATGGILRMGSDDTSILSGDYLGGLLFESKDTTSGSHAAFSAIYGRAYADHGPGDNATGLEFWVTPDGSASAFAGMTLDDNGQLKWGNPAGAYIASSDDVVTTQPTAIGDILYSTDGAAWTVLPAGTIGYALKVSGANVPAWEAITVGSHTLDSHAAGDLTETRIKEGPDNTVLRTDGTTVNWAAVPYSELSGIPSTFAPAAHLYSVHSDTIPSTDVVGPYTGITAVGVLTAGQWTGTKIAANYGGTDQSEATMAAGDILRTIDGSNWEAYSATTDGFILTLVSGVPAWAALSIPAHTLDSHAAGDLTETRIKEGPDNTVLRTDGTTVSWAAVPYSELSGIPSTFAPAAHLYSVHSDTIPSTDVVGPYTGITAVGVLTAGQWTGTKIAANYGGTDQSAATMAAGDILRTIDGSNWEAYSATTDGYVLTLVSGVPAWAVNSLAAHTLDSHAAGDLTVTRIAEGPDNTVLRTDGTTVSWAAVPYSELSGIPSTFAPTAHASAHHSGGGDVLTLASIGGSLAASRITTGEFGGGNYTFPANVLVTGQSYQADGVYFPAGHSLQTGTLNLDWDNGESQMVTMGAGALTINVDNGGDCFEGSSYRLTVHGPASGSQTLTIGQSDSEIGTNYSGGVSLATNNSVIFHIEKTRNRADSADWVIVATMLEEVTPV